MTNLDQLNAAVATLSTLPAWEPGTKPAPGHVTIEVLYGGGDLTVTCDPKEPDQQAKLAAGFDALAALGYAAMVTAPPAREGQTAVLDPEAEALVFVPAICGG